MKMFVNFHMLIQAYKTKLTNIFIQNMAKTHAHKISRMCMRALTHTHTHTHTHIKDGTHTVPIKSTQRWYKVFVWVCLRVIVA